MTTRELPLLPATGAPPVPAWEGESVRVGETELFVRRAGVATGEPCVFVHGLGGSSTNWTDLKFLLAPEFDLHALDLPGFGRSGQPHSYEPRAHATAVIAYLEHLGRGPVHLFGNSLGGAISLLVASRRPDLVRTLTLVSPAMPDFRPRWKDDRIRLALTAAIGARGLRGVRRETVADRVRYVLELCFHDLSTFPAERIEEGVAEAKRMRGVPWAEEALVASVRSLVLSQFRSGRRSWWARAARVQAPTLVVWGRHDRLVSSRLAPRLAAAIPNSTLLLLEDTGHVSQIERPVEVARAFLQMRDGLAEAQLSGS